MDIQQIIALVLGIIALCFVGRHVWREVEGLIRPSKAGGCPGCGGCDAALAAADEAEALQKKTPLVTVQTALPPHLEHLRRPQTTPDD